MPTPTSIPRPRHTAPDLLSSRQNLQLFSCNKEQIACKKNKHKY